MAIQLKEAISSDILITTCKSQNLACYNEELQRQEAREYPSAKYGGVSISWKKQQCLTGHKR